MGTILRLGLAILAVTTGVQQQYNSADFSDFTRSPSGHVIDVIEHPLTIHSIQGVISFQGHPGQRLVDVLFEIQGPSPAKTIRQATTDKNGRFKIGQLKDGSYKFKAI
jgi:Prealbumin-like fold domain